MTRGKRLSLILMASGLVAFFFLAAAPSPASSGMTVGEFVTLVAAQLQPAPGDKAPTTPEASAEVLSKVGVRIRSTLSSPLTAGDAADIFRQLGITLQAQYPDRSLEKDRAAALVATFGDTLKARSAGSAPISTGVSTSRSSSGAPAPPTLEDLLTCQNLSKVKDCHDCCKALGTYTNRVCAQACSNSPKASAMEPTP